MTNVHEFKEAPPSTGHKTTNFILECTDKITSKMKEEFAKCRDRDFAASERIARLEAIVKYLSPSAQSGDLVDNAPEVQAAKQAAEKTIEQAERKADTNEKLYLAQRNKALEGERAIELLRQRIRGLEKRAGVVGLDATRKATATGKPVRKLAIGNGKRQVMQKKRARKVSVR